MPNHVHLVLCPRDESGLARARCRAQAMGELHQRFDGRFASVATEEAHLTAALRYVALNPVRAA